MKLPIRLYESRLCDGEAMPGPVGLARRLAIRNDQVTAASWHVDNQLCKNLRLSPINIRERQGEIAPRTSGYHQYGNGETHAAQGTHSLTPLLRTAEHLRF
jgi:hypothetical protein